LKCRVQTDTKEKKIHDNETCVIKFEKEEDLENIIQEFQRNELLPYNRIFILPAKSYDLSHQFKEVSLKPIEKKYNVIFKTVKAENEDEKISGALITISKNGKVLVPEQRIDNYSHEINDLRKDDTLAVKCTKPGRIDFDQTIKVEELVKNVNGYSVEYKIKLKENEFSYTPFSASENKKVAEIDNKNANGQNTTDKQSHLTFEITVTDEEGNPIENANVSLKKLPEL